MRINTPTPSQPTNQSFPTYGKKVPLIPGETIATFAIVAMPRKCPVSIVVRQRAIPRLKIAKIGIVSRNYNDKYANGFRDFSSAFRDVLNLLDNEGCDSVLFSLYSIVPRKSFSPFVSLLNIKSVFYEEFTDGKKRHMKQYVVQHRKGKKWRRYILQQKFGSLREISDDELTEFVRHELPSRMLGNCCVLLCGESNGVKYSRKCKHVEDHRGLRQSLPKGVTIVLNPVHDRMTRFEMNLKRSFLSENSRWVVSVWNKGKRDKNGKCRDGQRKPWTVFHNGENKESLVKSIENKMGLYIGVLEVKVPIKINNP